MKAGALSLAVTALTGVAVGVFASTLQLEAAAREAAQLGALVASLTGVVALLYKARVDSRAAEGTAALRAQFSAQVLTLGMRAVVVLAGALALRAQGEEAPVAFALAFLVVYLLQLFVEVRLLLSAHAARPVSR
jgi:hypothetical protein